MSRMLSGTCAAAILASSAGAQSVDFDGGLLPMGMEPAAVASPDLDGDGAGACAPSALGVSSSRLLTLSVQP